MEDETPGPYIRFAENSKFTARSCMFPAHAQSFSKNVTKICIRICNLQEWGQGKQGNYVRN